MRPYRSAPHAGGYTGNDPQLMEPDTEPTAGEWQAARDELGPWAEDWQLERRALELASEAVSDCMDTEDYA